MDAVSLPVIGLGTGWAVAIVVVLTVIRGFLKGQIVSGAVYEQALNAADKIVAQMDRLQETHAMTTAQNGELLETTRFTRAVTEAVDATRRGQR